MSDSQPIQFEAELTGVFQALRDIQSALDGLGLDPNLRHLVHLRASQINGCAYCIRLHSRQARKQGETNARLDHLTAWEEMEDYTPAERAALAWTEALTRLPGNARGSLAELRRHLREHFSEQQLAALTMEVAMINQWNRIAISNH